MSAGPQGKENGCNVSVYPVGDAYVVPLKFNSCDQNPLVDNWVFDSSYKVKTA